MAAMTELRDELGSVARDPALDFMDRSVAVAAILTEALAPLHVEPVLVGGMAVRLWSGVAEFVTRDIDLVMDEPPAAEGVLRDLGLVLSPNGRHWELPDTDVFVEMPSRHLPDGAEVERLVLASGRSVSVLSHVDVLIVRLEELSIGPHEDVARQALALIPRADRTRLHQRARDVGVAGLLSRLEPVADAVVAGSRAAPSAEELYDLVKGP